MLSVTSGPNYTGGQMGYAPTLGAGYSDFNSDAGPNIVYQGDGIPDIRVAWPPNDVGSRTGTFPAFINLPGLQSVEQVPAAFGTATIAALANVTSGTAMTLVSANAAGISINVPIIPFSAALNSSAVVTAPIVLDFGFAYGATTAGSTTMTVPDSTVFTAGMPLVIVGAGSAGGALLTWVAAAPTATTITLNDAAVATIASAAIGTGNIWTPREGVVSVYPTAHLPYLAGGTGLFLDPRQGLDRGVSITGVTGGTGGAFVVSGWDIYWQPMNETITATAGATTTYGKKAFKAIKSVTPGFTDAHNYSVGTSDVFGFAFRSDQWEYSDVNWAGAFMTSSTGWTAWAAPASGDVRGTIQVSAQGGGSGIGTNNSNGALSSNVMTGRRLAIFQMIPAYNLLRATPQAPQYLLGATQT